ncbi:MFS transporter [Lactobacillus delbrueckii]|uniref:MFS transporter n=1 Tax=Lactobacillus delbrueckii TaxID=1584 RepID=UPI003A874F40
MGTGIALTLMFNIILEQVAADKIGLMMGFGNLITGVAPALGPTFGGLVINNLGWRYVVFFLMPFDHLVSLLRPLRHPAEVQDRQDQAGLLEHCLYRCSLCRRYLWLQQPFIRQIADQSLSDLYRPLFFGFLAGPVQKAGSTDPAL